MNIFRKKPAEVLPKNWFFVREDKYGLGDETGRLIGYVEQESWSNRWGVSRGEPWNNTHKFLGFYGTKEAAMAACEKEEMV